MVMIELPMKTIKTSEKTTIHSRKLCKIQSKIRVETGSLIVQMTIRMEMRDDEP
jgi:hypothetical protein